MVILSCGGGRTQIDPRICRAGDIECTVNGARICNEAETHWIDGSCAADQACVSGGCGDATLCPDVCKDIVCGAGNRFCGSDNVFVYECDETGTTGCYVNSCASPPIDGVCFQGNCLAVCTVEQKSYLGCEYFPVDLDNARVPCGGGGFCDAAGSQFSVVVSNPRTDDSAYVIVTKGELPPAPAVEACQEPGMMQLPNNFVMAAVIPPKGIQIFDLPGGNDINGTVKASLAFRLGSNIPITAYQFNPLENVDVFSNDASMLLPVTTAGNEYFVMTRLQLSPSLRGYVSIVGVRPEPVEVTIKVSATTAPGPGIPGLRAGETFTTTLKRYDVLSLQTGANGADLTGSLVQANGPVMVFGGHEAANAPTKQSECNLVSGRCFGDDNIVCGCSTEDGPNCNPHEACPGGIPCCADHIEQQLFPTSAWGRSYLAVRSYTRAAEPDVWRILAKTDGTRVTLDPPLIDVPPLQRGQWFEFSADIDFQLTSTEPVMLGQFLVGETWGNASIGDPAFMLAVPNRQFREAYVFLAPNKYARDYVSIAVPIGARALLDGEEASSLPLSRVSDIGASGWRSIRVPISDGFHNLVCPNTCSVMVHGYDQYVSYAYPGGLNLLECSRNSDCSGSTPQCRKNVCVSAQ